MAKQVNGRIEPSKAPGRRRLLKWDDLTPWMKQTSNSHIRIGYRPETTSLADCFCSVAAVHNETVNIWTHLLGCLVFLWQLAQLVLATGSGPPSVTWIDKAAFACFYFGGALCLGFSATFHTCSCHRHASLPMNRLDYCGIVALIWGSFVPAIRTAFFCYPRTAVFFVGLVTFLSAATIYTVLAPNAHSNEFRRRRTWTFIGLGLSAVPPVGYACFKFGIKDASTRMSLPWLVGSGATYIVGAIFYAEAFPEAFFRPGRFDIVGASHQLFHLAILFAAFSHYIAITKAHRITHEVLQGVCLPDAVATLLKTMQDEV